tara:strand:+ start:447 stop:1646 length:1200 start_codon:yes stop_codon:yes gene_type:complete
MKTINNYQIFKKKVLLRVDLNVPVVDGLITDKSRINSIKSTVFKLLKNKNKIFLVSHFGRPQGKYNKKFSLEFLKETISKELNLEKIYFIEKINKKNILEFISIMNFGEVALLENIRFFSEEEKNDSNFSREFSEYFDIYVNDAFSVSHRNHASIVGITKFLPSVAGESLINEIKNLDVFINNPKKPNTAIIGGAKISTKIELLNNLVEHFNNIVVGGAMANTFLLSQGHNVGLSIVEKDLVNLSNQIINKAKKFNCNLILPIDVVCSNNIRDSINIRHSKVENIMPDQMILDLGDKTIKTISNVIIRSNMILWNGPVGAFEYEPFDHATMQIVNTIKNNSKKLNIITLVGGGDTLSAIKMAKAENYFTYISTAGGAFLEWLEGKKSPGVQALKDNKLS